MPAYDVLRDINHHREKAATLNHLKAKIVRLYSKRLQAVTVETNDHNLLQGEKLSLFHLLKIRTRHASRMITSVLDKDGDIQTTTKGILHSFVAYLLRKYCAISVDLESGTQMEKAGLKTVPTVWRDLLDSPVSMEELKTAVNKAAGNKAPGRDGTCLEFSKQIK